MDGEYAFDWNDVLLHSAAPPGPDHGIHTHKPPLRKAYHRRSNSTPLEHTSSVLLNLTGEERIHELNTEQDQPQQEQQQPAVVDARPERLRSRREPKALRRSAAAQAAGIRSGGISGSRMSARNVKGKSKLAVLHEGFGVSSDEDQELSGDDVFGSSAGRGDKVKRVLANRQSAQRSRIRKLAHIEELMHTAQMLQNDINKMGPQLNALHTKQAGLDKEKEALLQQLAALMQESQQKESVNQSLTHEIANYAQAQQTTGQTLGHSYQHQQQQQQQQQHAAPDHQNVNEHSGHASQSAGTYAAPEETDIVDRLMLRYQYDQAQAWQRHQQQHQQQQHQQHQHQQQQHQQHQHPHQQHQQQEEQQQQQQHQLQWQHHQQYQQQQPQAASSSQRSSHTAIGSYQEAQLQYQWQQLQQQHQHQHQHQQQLASRQSSAQQMQQPQASWAMHNRSSDEAAAGLRSRHHSLDNAETHRLTQSPLTQSPELAADSDPQRRYLYTQQQTLEQLHRLQRHSFDAAQLRHGTSQQSSLTRPRTAEAAVPEQESEQQSLFRTQYLTPYQSQSVQGHQPHPAMQQHHHQQQQSHSGQFAMPEQAVRGLQRHSTGQTMPDLQFIPLRGNSPQVASWQAGSGNEQIVQSGVPISHGGHLQHQQVPSRNNSGSVSLHSASHLSRHSSGGSDAQLSDILPSDTLLRTWELASNASSEPSEPASNALHSSHGSSGLSAMGLPANSSGQTQAAGSVHHATPVDGLRQVVWSKGMPPSGKKKKDPAAAQRAVFTRLI